MDIRFILLIIHIVLFFLLMLPGFKSLLEIDAKDNLSPGIFIAVVVLEMLISFAITFISFLLFCTACGV